MKRVDANHAEIVKGLRNIGATVRSTAIIGSGFPDIAVGFRKQNWFFEIKDGNKRRSQTPLTEAEALFFGTWNGQVDIVYSLEDALRIIMKPT